MQDLFDDLIARDEFQLEGMQVYSHILYISEDFAALSHLAHKAVLVDKYRHETACIIGNYYSLKQQHHKARPAARPAPSCLCFCSCYRGT
jgi:anaphase-promoting complex subunit 8